jgi:hypothetical protein
MSEMHDDPLCDVAAKHIANVASILDAATGGKCNYTKFDEDILNAARDAAFEIDRLHNERSIASGFDAVRKDLAEIMAK